MLQRQLLYACCTCLFLIHEWFASLTFVDIIGLILENWILEKIRFLFVKNVLFADRFQKEGGTKCSCIGNYAWIICVLNNTKNAWMHDIRHQFIGTNLYSSFISHIMHKYFNRTMIAMTLYIYVLSHQFVYSMLMFLHHAHHAIHLNI